MDRLATVPANVRGAMWMVGTVFGLSTMGTLAKWLGQDFHPFQIVFFRCFLAFVLLLPVTLVMLRHGSLQMEKPLLHVLRTITATFALFLAFYSVTQLDLATATALFFTRPLFFVILAVVVLGNKVGWRRALATIAGFGGALIISNPGQIAAESGTLAALASAFFSAIAVLVVSLISRQDRPLVVLVMFTIGTSITSFPFAATVWIWPEPHHFWPFITLAVVGTLGQYCLVRAFKVGDPVVMNPIDYGQIVVGAVFGYLLFAEVPPGTTWFGALIIVGASLYILLRTEKLGKTPPQNSTGVPED